MKTFIDEAKGDRAAGREPWSLAQFVKRLKESPKLPDTFLIHAFKALRIEEMRLRQHVVADMKERFAGVLTPAGPVAMATMLDARYGPQFLRRMGCDDESIRRTSQAVGIWIDDLVPEADDVAVHNAAASFLLPDAAASCPRRETRSAFNRYLQFTMTAECAALYPPPTNLSTAELNIEGAQQRLLSLYGAGGKFSELGLVAMALSALPATSTAAERAQSIAGRVCARCTARACRRRLWRC